MFLFTQLRHPRPRDHHGSSPKTPLSPPPHRGPKRPDRNATVLNIAAHTLQNISARSPPPMHAEQKIISVRTVVHRKTVAINPNPPLYPITGKGSVLFQGPQTTEDKYWGRGMSPPKR